VHGGIEVTEEMIKAGRSELISYDHDFDSPESAVVRIFSVMAAAAPPKLSSKSNARVRGKPR